MGTFSWFLKMKTTGAMFSQSDEEGHMKKILVRTVVVLSVIVFTSCAFKGTATFHLQNNTLHTITAVNFLAVVGGETKNRAVTISAGDGLYFYRIEPGTYDIQTTVEGIGTFIAYNDFVFEEGTTYFRSIKESDLP
jgi:hypothetical protein